MLLKKNCDGNEVGNFDFTAFISDLSFSKERLGEEILM